MPRRRRKGGTLCERVEKRRARYEAKDLDKAIQMFFHAIDEDGSGKLEAPEFAVAQVVLAQLADEEFNEDAFGNIGNFDKSGDGAVTVKEFLPVMRDLCQALSGSRADLLEDIADKAAEVITETRREIGREIREFFRALDIDKTGYLEEAEIKIMANLAIALQQEVQPDIALKVPVEEFLSLKAFENGLSTDGKISISEFLDHFLDFTKKLKIPKKELVFKLKQLVAEALGKPAEAPVEQTAAKSKEEVMREMEAMKKVLDQYR